jgi:hypothetical protein
MSLTRAQHVRHFGRKHSVTAALIVTVFGGILVDVVGCAWGQMTASAWAWFAFLVLIVRTRNKERLELLMCVCFATIGELFLCSVWRLYEYRLHNLPLFIPPGHAIVYALGRRVSGIAPVWFPHAIVAVMAPLAIAGSALRYDTQAPLWCTVFVVCIVASRERGFLATMFVLALIVETYGTTLGDWSYRARDPWFGLTTITTPPVWAGTLYCGLACLVTCASGLKKKPSYGSSRKNQCASESPERMIPSAASFAERAAASTQPISKPCLVQSPAK